VNAETAYVQLNIETDRIYSKLKITSVVTRAIADCEEYTRFPSFVTGNKEI